MMMGLIGAIVGFTVGAVAVWLFAAEFVPLPSARSSEFKKIIRSGMRFALPAVPVIIAGAGFWAGYSQGGAN